MTQHLDTAGKFGPVSKTASGASAAIGLPVSVVLVYVLTQFGFDIPEPVAAAIASIIGAIIAAVAGKLVSPDRTIEFQQEQGNLPMDV